MFGSDNWRAVLFAAYGFAVWLVVDAALMAILLAIAPRQEPRLSIADQFWWAAYEAAIAAGLAFVLWRLVGPSTARSRRGLRPAVLGALIGWFAPILSVSFTIAKAAIAVRDTPESAQLSAEMRSLAGYWPILLAVVALNPASWFGLAFGALAGWVYQTRIVPIDEPVDEARARASLPQIAIATVLTVATAASVFTALFLIVLIAPALHAEISVRISSGFGVPGVARGLAVRVLAILLLLLAPPLSWWLFTRQRTAVALALMLIPLLLVIAVWMALSAR